MKNTRDKKITPAFDDLTISTCTVVVYSNVVLNLEKIFESFVVKYIKNVPLTKKKKNVDKSKIKAEEGEIISCRWGDYLRGVPLKMEKYRCVICCPVTQKKYKKVYPKTVVKTYIPYKDDIKKAVYTCEKCSNKISSKELAKIPDFLNQICLVMYLYGRFLNIMIFKDIFKMVGFKNEMHAIYAIHRLKYCLLDTNLWVSINGEDPKYIFFLAMKNYEFQIGFPMDMIALNELMNEKKYRDKIYMSQRDSTRGSNVNIKFYTEKPSDYEYINITYKKGKPVSSFSAENPLLKKPLKQSYVTFIVFSSSEVILSGRYKDMEDAYNFFVKCIKANKSKIKEHIVDPTMNLVQLKSELGLRN
jgi:hypothetical protein